MKSNFGKIFENIVYYLIFLPGLIYLSWASMRDWVLELSDPHSTVFLFEKKCWRLISMVREESPLCGVGL